MDRRSFISSIGLGVFPVLAGRGKTSEPAHEPSGEAHDDAYKPVEPYLLRSIELRSIEQRVHAYARGRGADVLLGDDLLHDPLLIHSTIAARPTWHLSQSKEPGLLRQKAEDAASTIIQQLSHVDLRAIGPMNVIASHEITRLMAGYVVMFHVIGPRLMDRIL